MLVHATPCVCRRPSVNSNSRSRSGWSPRRYKVDLGIQVYVEPVSTSASKCSKRLPVLSPTSTATRKAPMILDRQSALVLPPDAAQDATDLAEGDVVFDAVDQDRHQIVGAGGGLLEAREEPLDLRRVAFGAQLGESRALPLADLGGDEHEA